MHLAVGSGLLKAARRGRQIGCTTLQIFSDNPTAWRRRPEPPPDAAQFVDYCGRHGIAPVAIHASYLVNLAGTAEQFVRQSREGLIVEMQRAPRYGATLVNTHIGSHLGGGLDSGLRRVRESVTAILSASPPDVRLVLENSAGGGDTVGANIEQLAALLDGLGPAAERLAFCLDTAHLWGAGYDIDTPQAATAVIDRFEELIGLDRLPLVHLNDSRSLRGSRADRHEHVGAGLIGPEGLGAFLRDSRLAAAGTAFVMETPGVEVGYDAVNMRRARLLYDGADVLPELPPAAFRLNRRASRLGPGQRRDTLAAREG